jgi:hypothetical protein
VSKPVLDNFEAIFEQLVQLDPAELDTDLLSPEHMPLALAEYIFNNYDFTERLKGSLMLGGLIEMAIRAQRGEPMGCEPECDCGWRPPYQRPATTSE